jgi:hypothetical protein
MTRIRSLILSDSDVRSVLDGTKRMHAVPVTLREFHVTDTPGYDFIFRDRRALWNDFTRAGLLASKYAPYQVGDMVWVREAFADSDERVPHYRADFDNLGRGGWDLRDATRGHVTVYKWRPATNMRRDESRLTLRVTDVSVKRLMDVTEEEALAMGYPDDADDYCDAADQFFIADRRFNVQAWADNTWVWMVAFERAGDTKTEGGRGFDREGGTE